MFVQELSIDINRKVDQEELFDRMCNLAVAIYQNGQGKISSSHIFERENRCVLIISTLEKNSLSRENCDVYVSKDRRILEKLCGGRLKIKLLGEDKSETVDICRCEAPDSYILFTGHGFVGSPLLCGDCGKNVPLYRIPGKPEPHEQDYYSLLCWDRAYRSCGQLEALCGFGEPWALRQLQRHDSGLAKEGREKGTEIAEITGKPVYYNLFNYRALTAKQDRERKCPECGGEWLLPEAWHKKFDFRCDLCRLVSSFTCNMDKKCKRKRSPPANDG